MLQLRKITKVFTSSVRRILKRGGGGSRNFRKFERNIDQNLKLPHSNFVPFFAQNQVKSKKKKVFKISSHLQSLMPNLQRGGGAMPQLCSLFYAILQSWCNPWPNAPPLNTPLVFTNFPRGFWYLQYKFSVFRQNFNGSKIVLSSSRGQGNFRGPKASRPRT